MGREPAAREDGRGEPRGLARAHRCACAEARGVASGRKGSEVNGFRLGAKSEENLAGVDERLVACVRYAIACTEQDFGVFEGLRSVERQKKLVLSGASRTMKSYHLTGEAVDLVPYVDGRLQWQMPLCNRIAAAMREASVKLDVPLVWGRVWDRRLGQLDPDKLEPAHAAYVERYQRANGVARFPLDDGPHFQLVRGEGAL
jgi:peptidoglycan LD-endopeptidase CwlK